MDSAALHLPPPMLLPSYPITGWGNPVEGIRHKITDGRYILPDLGNQHGATTIYHFNLRSIWFRYHSVHPNGLFKVLWPWAYGPFRPFLLS